MRRAWLLALAGALIVVALVLMTGWYTWIPPRNAVPKALVETARIAGYGDIRYWGDEMTPAFERDITKLYEEIKSGVAPAFLDKAVFLAISGGGDNGAFTAGLIKGWTERGNRPAFEAVTGVSTGALAAPFVFLGPDHDEELRDIYIEHGSRDLYINRGIFGILGNAMKDTAPLEALIRKHATDKFLDEIAEQYHHGRRLLAATTNLDAQRPMIWDLTGIAASGRPDRRDLFVKVLLASAAIPGVFPPVRISVVADDGKTYDELHVDGGVTSEVVFVPPEVNLTAFEQKVFGKLRDRTLYVIRNGKLAPEYAASKDQTLALAARGVATLVKYQVLSNLRIFQRWSDGDKTHFFYDAIPYAFDAHATSEFDRNYAEALYGCGREVGRTGLWSTDVPLTPELVPRQHPDAPNENAAQAATMPKPCRP